MRIPALFLVAVLAACGPDPALDLSTAISDDLLACAERPVRNAKTQRDVALLLVDYDDAHGGCRAKLEAVRNVLRTVTGEES